MTLGGLGAAGALTLLVSVAMARLLGPGGAGVVQLSQTLGNQLALVFSLGLTTSVMRFVATEGRPQRTIGSLLVFLACLVPVISGVFLLAPLLARPLVEGTGASYWAIVLAVPTGYAFIGQDVMLAVYRGRNEFAKVVGLSVAVRACVTLSVIAAVLLSSRSALTAVVASLCANCAMTALVIVVAVRQIGMDTADTWDTMRRLLRFNLVGHVGTILQEVSYRIDLFLVALLLSTQAAGVYGVAGLLCSLLWYLPNALGAVLLPRISNSAGTAEARRRLVTASRVTLAVMIAAGVGAGCVATVGIPLVFGEDFASAVVPFLILLPGATLLSVWKVIVNALSGLGLPEVKLPSAALGAVVGLALDLVLIPRWGINGAAIAATIAYSVCTFAVLPTAARAAGSSRRLLLSPDAVGAIQMLSGARTGRKL